jgi:predicted AAA+ superfamily ATPase
MWLRQITQSISSTKKSVLILGPRQVGKSTLIRSLNPELTINFALESDFFEFQHNPRELQERLSKTNPRTVFIDEVQRVPKITNTIQAILDENPKLKFYLTGSSARKLRKGRANLLPGRIVCFELCPLSIQELHTDWNENDCLAFGSLPGVLAEKNLVERKRILKSYAQTYLKEEIVAEAVVKNTESFTRFLMASAGFAGKYLDLSKLAKVSKSPRQNTVRHFEILEDTLLAQRVYADPALIDKGIDLVKHPRFFYFDNGVLNALLGSFELSSDRIGPLFEHLVFNQVRTLALSQEKDFKAFNLRTRGGFEIDFIFKIDQNYFAVECKASDEVDTQALSCLKRVKEFYKKISPMVIYRGKKSFIREGIPVLPLSKAMAEMGF